MTPERASFTMLFAMIERKNTLSALAPRATAALMLAACGLAPAFAASDPVQRPSLYSATARMRAVPLPLPRPPELEEEDAQQAGAEDGAQNHGQAVASLPSNPPSLYTTAAPPNPQQAYAVEPPPVAARSFVLPPPLPESPHTLEANRAPPGNLPAACASLVQQNIMVAAAAPPIGGGKGACAVPSPVQLSAVRLEDGTTVTLQPAATLRCDAAVAVTQWVREDLSRAAMELGGRLDTVKVAASYDCRSRNRIAGAKISDHGMGIAMDVGGVVLDDKRVYEVKGNGLPMALQASMKASACSRFTTVLGPGSDGYHEDHVHVDLAQRYLNIRLCRWEIRPTSIALPRSLPGAGASVAVASAPASPQATAEAVVSAQAGTATFQTGEEAMVEEDVPLPLPRPPIAANGRQPARRTGG